MNVKKGNTLKKRESVKRENENENVNVRYVKRENVEKKSSVSVSSNMNLLNEKELGSNRKKSEGNES